MASFFFPHMFLEIFPGLIEIPKIWCHPVGRCLRGWETIPTFTPEDKGPNPKPTQRKVAWSKWSYLFIVEWSLSLFCRSIPSFFRAFENQIAPLPRCRHLQMLNHVHLSTLLKLGHEFLHRAIAGRWHGGKRSELRVGSPTNSSYEFQQKELWNVAKWSWTSPFQTKSKVQTQCEDILRIFGQYSPAFCWYTINFEPYLGIRSPAWYHILIVDGMVLVQLENHITVVLLLQDDQDVVKCWKRKLDIIRLVCYSSLFFVCFLFLLNLLIVFTKRVVLLTTVIDVLDLCVGWLEHEHLVRGSILYLVLGQL